MKFKLTVSFLLLLLATTADAQEKKRVKFGKVTPDDFQTSHYTVDTSAAAIILSHIGSSEFEGDNEGFKLVHKQHFRARVLNKNGYDIATVEIPLYRSGQQEEKVTQLKAYTYNLENGQVVQTQLENSSVFTEQQDKNHFSRKFTFPAVKEGSIIEYTYTVNSDFYFNLQPWNFQSIYPTLLSEYEVTVPEVYEFVFLMQGFHPFGQKDKKDARRQFSFRVAANEGLASSGRTEAVSLLLGISTYFWQTKDVPALRLENYTTSLKNHMTRIDFQLASVRWPNNPARPVMGTYQKMSEDLLKNENYGADLSKGNGYLSDVVKELVKGANTPEEKAKRIYAYVRDHFTCTDRSAIYTTKSLKSTFNSKSGNVSEINLLLVAMLKSAGLESWPVILSTRRHGFTSPIYPLLDRFNYSIAAVQLDDSTANYLDATYRLGFGKLHPSCYNGHARVVNPDATPLTIAADDLLEQRLSSAFIAKGANGKLEGFLQYRPTYFESYDIREKIRDKGKESVFKQLEDRVPFNATFKNGEVEDIDSLERSVLIKYEFEAEAPKDNILYINPMMGEAMKENPFKSQVRTYPVEMPSVMDNNFSLNLQIPDGYVVDELPKPTVVKFNDNEGVFQYLIAQSGDNIQFRSRIKLNSATFAPEDYEALRGFFDMIVKKQAELIVLKKTP